RRLPRPPLFPYTTLFRSTVTFNLEILKKRLKEVTDVTLKEIARDQAHYNVERLIIALLGDIIESYTMHNLESARGCEFGNSRQRSEERRVGEERRGRGSS